MTDLQLKAFIAAAETLNFTTTSSRLYMTPSTLSRQISSLENELGVKLFLRQNNVLELTEAGRFFYDKVKNIYADLDTSIRQLKDLAAGVEGELLIGVMSDQTMVEPLITAIRSLLQRHPNVKIDMCWYSYRDLIDHLERHDIDIAQALLYEGLSPDIFDDMTLTEEPMYLAYNPNYFHTDKTIFTDDVDLTDSLGDYPLYYPSVSSYPEAIQKRLPPLFGCFATCGRRLDSPSSAQLYLKLGMGATMVNRNNILANDPGVNMIPVRQGGVPPVNQGVIWRKNSTNPVLKMLLELLKESELAV